MEVPEENRSSSCGVSAAGVFTGTAPIGRNNPNETAGLLGDCRSASGASLGRHQLRVRGEDEALNSGSRYLPSSSKRTRPQLCLCRSQTVECRLLLSKRRVFVVAETPLSWEFGRTAGCRKAICNSRSPFPSAAAAWRGRIQSCAAPAGKCGRGPQNSRGGSCRYAHSCLWASLKVNRRR